MAKKNYREIYNTINAVEGFDPAKVVEQNEEGDSVLRIRDRLAWFKLKCPNGRIETDLHSFNGNIAIVKASIFAEVHYNSSGTTENNSTQRSFYSTPLIFNGQSVQEINFILDLESSSHIKSEFEILNEFLATNSCKYLNSRP